VEGERERVRAYVASVVSGVGAVVVGAPTVQCS
jgi:hypothetical protein